MAQVKVSVSVANSHLNHILEVAEGLRSAGLQVEQVMDAIGVITGTSEADKVAVLSKVTGVAHVEKAQSFQLPPPGSSIQ